MNLKKIHSMVLFLMAVTFFIFSEGSAQTALKETKAPVITHSYAAEKGRYGSIWRIYLEAEDPEGDMQKIAVVVDQPGYGRYPTDFIILKPQYKKNLKGYLQWNTFSSKTRYLREWTQITLKVSIFNKAGNESNEVVFPFSFETGVGREPKPPAPFDQGDIPKLGNIHIDLIEPTMRESIEKRWEK